tara:strand:- start:114 stop:365 length:252 start_codon:yes stop_codon:yes gene_type:complete
MNLFTKQKICAVTAAVLINLILPQLAKLVATDKQKQMTTQTGVVNKVVHMLVMHADTPITSSLIVALIVCLSICLGPMLCKYV